MILVIMAGGLGSRFGGLKQIEPIDEDNNFIIDYTIFDAIKCGFDKVIFVINKDNYEIVKSTVGERVKDYIKVEYAFQENEFPEFRKKPLGTAHAVLSAKNKIDDDFVVVNADDFYGYESLLTAKNSLNNSDDYTYSMVAFELQNTLSDFGKVKRGICKIKDGFLLEVDESQAYKNGDEIFYNKINETKENIIDGKTPVSMNLWAFKRTIFEFMERDYKDFCLNEDNLKFKEFFLPGVIENAINNNEIKVKVFLTTAKWFGITYKEDKPFFVENLKKLKLSSVYPKHLWKN